MVTTPIVKNPYSINPQNFQRIILEIIQPMVGEICQKVKFSYGDELRLELGEMIPYQSAKLQKAYKGSWRLGTRATPWELKQDHQILVPFLSSDEPQEEVLEQIQQRVRCLEGQTLIEVKLIPDFLVLILHFTENYQLTLRPDLTHETAESALADWELFLPTEQLLSVGPGYFWSCRSIHERY